MMGAEIPYEGNGRKETVLSADFSAQKEQMSDAKITATYVTGTVPTHPTWDLLHAIYKDEHGSIVNSLLLARTPEGTILRKTDLMLDWWEEPTEEKDLRFFESVFDERDKARIESETSPI